MHVARELAGDQILTVYAHLRSRVPLSGHEPDGALRAAREVHAEKSVEIAELRDAQSELPMALGQCSVRGEIPLHMRTFPLRLANEHSERIGSAAIDRDVEL